MVYVLVIGFPFWHWHIYSCYNLYCTFMKYYSLLISKCQNLTFGASSWVFGNADIFLLENSNRILRRHLKFNTFLIKIWAISLLQGICNVVQARGKQVVFDLLLMLHYPMPTFFSCLLTVERRGFRSPVP